MKFKNASKVALICSIGWLLVSFQNCSGVGQPNHTSSSSEGKGGTTTDNPKPTVDLLITRSGSVTSANAQLCLNEIQFAGMPPALSSAMSALAAGDNAAFQTALNAYTQSLMGMDLTLLPQENFVKTITVGAGSVSEIDLNLGGGCAFGSLAFPSAAGFLQITEPQVLHFTGNLNALQSGQIVLNMDPILAALAGAHSVDQAKAILANVSGTF